MKLLHPGIEADARDSVRHISPRLARLDGARIAMLDNCHHNVSAAWERVAVLLKDTYGVETVAWKKANANSPASAEILDAAAEFGDAVVNGIGDCGSCTSWSIHDATELERRSVPTVTVITHAFRLPAALRSSSLGIPDLRVVEMGHPLASMSVQTVQHEMELIFSRLAESLLDGV